MGFGINYLRPQAILQGYGIGDQDYGMGGENQFMTPQQPMIPNPMQQAQQGPPAAVPNIPFQTGPPQGGAPPPVTSPRVPSYEDINKIYTPETRAGNRLNTLLDAPPQLDPNPSFARRLSAGLMGIGKGGGIETMDRVLQAPYLQDMASWTAKSKPFHDAAQLENTANINERTLAGNYLTAQTQADKLAENARQADQRNEVARTANRIRDAKNNGITVKLDGNRWVGFDLNGKRYDLGTSAGMTREDIIDAQGEWNVKAAEARGDAAVRTAQAGGGNIFQDPSTGKRYIPDPDNPGQLKEVIGGPSSSIYKPGTTPRTTGAGTTSTLEKVRVRNEKLGQAHQTGDEIVRRLFVKKVGEGRYEFKDRPKAGTSGGVFGYGATTITPEEVAAYDEFRSSIEPDYKPPKAKLIGPPTPPTTPGGGGRGGGNTGRGGQPPRVTPPTVDVESELTTGARIKIYDRNGKVAGTIPNNAESRAAAAKSGYTVK